MATINQKPGTCIECGTAVAPYTGGLYRHSGANMRVNGRRLARPRDQQYAYVVRCRACADKRQDSPWRPA
jgi:hypothetical protein